MESLVQWPRCIAETFSATCTFISQAVAIYGDPWRLVKERDKEERRKKSLAGSHGGYKEREEVLGVVGENYFNKLKK